MKMCLGTLSKAGKIVEMMGSGSEPGFKTVRLLPLDKYFRAIEFHAEIKQRSLTSSQTVLPSFHTQAIMAIQNS